MTKDKLYWRDKLVDDLPREELINAVYELAALHRSAVSNHADMASRMSDVMQSATDRLNRAMTVLQKAGAKK